MQIDHSSNRRQFLRIAAGFTSGALLSGCGGGGSSGTSDAINVVPAGTTAASTAAVPGSHPLNVVLNLAYVGSAFYGIAARGTGTSAAFTAGVGQVGTANGGRAVSFADTGIAAYAAELADDKQAHVATLRTAIGARAAAQPTIDLSASPSGAFSVAARQAGIVGMDASFDPYAGDGAFLLGAFLVENIVAAAYRTLLVEGADGGSPLVAEHLADAIYHGGLIRSLIDGRADTDPATSAALAKASTMLMTLDGTDGQMLPAAPANLLDADERPIPFLRESGQVLRVLYLSGSGGGGFLPAGANGIT